MAPSDRGAGARQPPGLWRAAGRGFIGHADPVRAHAPAGRGRARHAGAGRRQRLGRAGRRDHNRQRHAASQGQWPQRTLCRHGRGRSQHHAAQAGKPDPEGPGAVSHIGHAHRRRGQSLTGDGQAAVRHRYPPARHGLCGVRQIAGVRRQAEERQPCRRAGGAGGEGPDQRCRAPRSEDADRCGLARHRSAA